ECPCPRCLVKKADIPKMGMKSDMKNRVKTSRVDDNRRRSKVLQAREHIFKGGKGVNSKRVRDLLFSESLVPTRNAFSDQLSELCFNFFVLFVVDLLHEFELGVWKAIFTHLMRILFAARGVAVQELNWRGTIRRFHKNASAMKRLAARDFEDLLQGLLPPPHNKIVLDLLFDLAVWHGYAKLRLHTDNTLDFFDLATTTLSHTIRKFQRTTCAVYTTTELPQEHAARGRRAAATAAKQGQDMPASHSGPKKKVLNLCTYKYHALGDYPNTIRRYGTTDSYSTQQGELEHRCSKRRFPRSGKKKDGMVRSIANQEAIERFVRKVNDAREKINAQDNPQPQRSRTSPSDHYHIAKSARQNENLTVWLGKRKDDPAVHDFIPRLKDHLLARLRGLAYDGDEQNFSDEDRDCVVIRDNKMYHHSMF
ncbi:hypothetical protein HYDPIDRAFT_58430, partial [Hydnomerulius pinastri MD-312]